MRSQASGLPLPLLADLDVPGTPLSPAEYERFFSALTPTWKAETACRLRATQGCQNHKLVQLDQYENHGTLPKGSVCTDLPYASWFESFCQFTQYRCSNRLFYAKRVLCSPSIPALSIHARSDSTTVPFSLSSVPTGNKVSLGEEVKEMKSEITALPSSGPNNEGLTPQTSQPWSDQLYPNIEELLKFPHSLEGQNSETYTESPYPSPLPSPVVIESIRALIQSSQALGGQNKTTLADEEPSPRSTDFHHPRSFSSSLLSLPGEEAMLVLCYAILSGSCPASLVAKAWQYIEQQMYGFKHEVCDSLGRRHMNPCQFCAFCSLKLEQCQSEVPLNREPCSETHSINFLSPLLSLQDSTTGTQVGTIIEGQYYGLDLYGGLRMNFWCGRLATKGCEDPRVSSWLQTEFLSFQDGDYPFKICDTDHVQHPNYCAFKSHQCLLHSQDRKVFRLRCLKNEKYSVLNIDKGEEAILLWSQEFNSITLGQAR
ncbi:acrosin-binding protein isoform X2 [Monodelphis domestica]|uniref:acrosin-binding protein isoform X2 n=1 Tax=Monodelphis domestica TaxID=13616 RepID=UPI0007B40A7E|nr:acrosin-binding protein isoform X2 [Monodelphis domestica]